MKLLAIMVILCGVAGASDLAELYKKGEVKLNLVENLIANADGIELREFVIADNGDIFVSSQSDRSVCKINHAGKIITKFGSKGSGPGQFMMRPRLQGVLDNKYVFTSEANGRLNFFTIDGSFYKMIPLDYMPLDCIPLRNNKIAVCGHVPMGDGDVKHIIVIIDIMTEDEQIIESKFTKKDDQNRIIIPVKKSNQLGEIDTNSSTYSVSFSAPFDVSNYFIRRAQDGNFIVGHSRDKTIRIFSETGAKTDEFSMNITPIKVLQSDIDEFYESLLQGLAKSNISDESITKSKVEDIMPEYRPYFYNMLIDSDGNLLVFVYNENDVNHKFRAYSYKLDGSLISYSTIITGNYEPRLSGIKNTIQFYNGYLYGTFVTADGGKDLQGLSKMKLSN